MSSRWAALAVIFVTRTSMGFQFQSIAAVAPLLVEDLRLSYAQAGLMMGLYMLPGVVVSLPSGMLGQRFGSRRVALWGLALMVAGGLVTGWSGGFAVACAGRVVSGIGGILLNLLLAKMVADWFRDREIATAMSVMLSAWPFGLALALLTLGSVAASASWRDSVFATVAAAALSLALLAWLYRDPPDLPSAAADGARLNLNLPRRAWGLACTAGLGWSLLNAGFIDLVSFAPAFLIAGGTSVAWAGVLVSLTLWVSIVSVPLGGWIADRIGHSNLVIVFGCLGAAAPMALLPLLPGAALWLILSGLLMSGAPGVFMALLPRAVDREHLATSLGVFYTVYYLGMAMAQPLAGVTRDLTGSPAMPLYVAAALMAATVLTLWPFRWLERRPVVVVRV
ncbi:MAG TPA: MFS transporter [Methylomirabilota bacterium]|nr:MFS transporter [Methylomirabilota bacterium]